LCWLLCVCLRVLKLRKMSLVLLVVLVLGVVCPSLAGCDQYSCDADYDGQGCVQCASNSSDCQQAWQNQPGMYCGNTTITSPSYPSMTWQLQQCCPTAYPCSAPHTWSQVENTVRYDFEGSWCVSADSSSSSGSRTSWSIWSKWVFIIAFTSMFCGVALCIRSRRQRRAWQAAQLQQQQMGVSGVSVNTVLQPQAPLLYGGHYPQLQMQQPVVYRPPTYVYQPQPGAWS